MRVAILHMNVKNFMGQKGQSLDVGGENLMISADNGCFKSTTASAFYWGLFGTDSTGASDFDLKPIDPKTGAVLSSLDTEVEIVLELEDEPDGNKIPAKGRQNITLKRVHIGATRKTEYYIDQVRKTEREWDDFLAGICDRKRWKILTDPYFFTSERMKDAKNPAWQVMRSYLMGLCELTDEEVIAFSPKLKGLPAILGNRTLEDHRGVLTQDRKRLKGRLAEIPARIDELTKQLISDNPAHTTCNAVSVSVDSPAPQRVQEDLRLELKALNEQRGALLAGGHAGELKAKLLRLEAEGQEIYHRLRQEASRKAEEAQRVLRQANFVLDAETRKLSTLQHELSLDRDALLSVEGVLNVKRAEYARLKAGVME